MSNAFNISHPLSDESGMSQRRRLSPALDATQNLLDSRDLADMLVYIHQFSKQVNFYDCALEVSNWSVFFEKSAPFILARLAKRDTEGSLNDFQQYNNLVKNDPNPTNFQLLLDFTYRTTVLDLAALYENTQSVGGFRHLLEQEISSREMTAAIRQFIGIANGAQSLLCGSPKDFSFLTKDDIWQLDITDIFTQNTPSVLSDKSDEKWKPLPQKQTILIYQQGIERFFDHFSQVLSRLSKAAERYLSESLYPLEVEFKERHEPHLGLLFAFLELFKHLKGQLNGMTARHLDFYFRQILKIQSRKAVPDAVHLVLEAQKHVKRQLLKKGVDFRDGKDANGQDILFSLDNEVVINKAQIKSLKTLFVKNRVAKNVKNAIKKTTPTDDTASNPISNLTKNAELTTQNSKPDTQNVEKATQNSEPETQNPLYTEGVFIAPVANSMDGKGMDFKEPITKNWATLGRDKSKFVPKIVDGNLEPQDNLLARLGFILASPVLFLQEGTRTITIELTLSEMAADLLEDYKRFEVFVKGNTVEDNEDKSKNGYQIEHLFKIYLSGEKEWIKVDKYKLFVENQLFMLVFTLEPTVDSVLHFNAENLKENYGTTEPVVKIEIDQTVKIPLYTEGSSPTCCAERALKAGDFDVSAYHFLKNVTVSGVKISVQVNGIKKHIIVQNDENLQDVNGLIYPFGTRPDVPDFSVSNYDLVASSTDGKQPPPKLSVREGSNFYIGSKEVFLKKCTQITIGLNWRDKPNDFTRHYGAYLKRAPLNTGVKDDFTHFGLQNEGFKFNAAYLSGGLWRREVIKGTLPSAMQYWDKALFVVPPPTLPNNTPFEQYLVFTPTDTIALTNQHDLAAPLTKLDANTRDGFMRLTLKNQDFLHKDYPFVLARQMMAFGRLPDAEVTSAIYMVDDVPQVSGRAELLKEIKTLLDRKQITKDVPDEVRKFIKVINDIFITAVANSSDWQTKLQDIKTLLKSPIASEKAVGDFFTEIIDKIIPILPVTVVVKLQSTLADIKQSLDDGDKGGQIKTNLRNFLQDISTKIDIKIASLETTEERYKAIKKIFDADEAKRVDEKAESISERVDALGKFADDEILIFDKLGVEGAKKALIPNEPWTPIIKNIALDYAAEADSADIALIHLYPFEATYKKAKSSKNAPLLPQFADEGTLFIGFEQLEPSTNIQILFQLAEATADTEGERADVKWHYLSKNNDWKDLRTGFEILEDATKGLTVSGIIKLAIPEDIGDKNVDNQVITQMPAGQFWLKVTAANNTRSVCETLGVFTQAVRATARFTEGSDLHRLSVPIAAESVAKLAVEDAAIKQVTQPFDSFGGQIEETGNTFYLRVSERLRHKGRAAMPFDYERLLLDAFPTIYKAKCIPHNLALPANSYQVDLPKAAGFITLAVIPDLTRLKSGDLTEPRVALSVLDDITAYLKQKTTPFARLSVVNPRYEKVNISFFLKLKKGRDDTYYKQQLETELRRFLAPWSVGDSDKLSFGQPIYYSDILTFIDQREYVDYVKCLKVNLADLPPKCTPSVNEAEMGSSTAEVGVLRPLTPRSVLVAGQITITT